MIDKVGSDILIYCGDAKDNNALEAETLPKNPNDIPGTAEGFARWWERQVAAGNYSGFLPEAAERAYLTLQSIEMNREPFKSRAFTELSARALDDFARQWAAHTKGER